MSDTDTCPQCGSGSVGYGAIEIQGTNAVQEAGCNDCNACWHDVYAFAERVLTEPGDN